MRTRCALLLVLIGISTIASAAPGGAGGWDSLTFPEDHYVVGEVASARAEFFAGTLEGTGSLDGGPYHAYLLPGSRDVGFGMIDAPTVPADAIRLGTLSVSGPFVAGDGYRYGRASLSFSVPEVPTGTYAIGFCDDPCTHSTVGWLAWGSITIVHTEAEGRLLRRLERERRRMDALSRELRRSEHRNAELEARLATARAGWRGPSTRAVSTEEPRLPTASPVPARVPTASATWWVALLAAGLGLGAGVAVGRRIPRAADRRIPGSVPAGLEEREPALRS